MRSLVIVTLLVMLGIVVCDDHAPNAVSYTSKTFSTEIARIPHFVMFYAPWCGHCKRLSPVWDELAQFFNKDFGMSKLIIGKVDCTLETALCADHDVTGYPTLKYFKKEGSESVRFRGSRGLREFQEFIEEQFILDDDNTEMEKPLEPEKALGPLAELTDETFEKEIATGNTFVKFYAPWCGHCKSLAPTWDSLAQEFEKEPSVTIAKVDCTIHKTTCGKQSIRGYPTLVFFKNGQKEQEYSNRDLNSLKNFVISMIGKENKNGDETEGKVPEDIPKDQEDEIVPTVFPLDQESFPEVVADGVTFVKFYAPWCGHCKRLAPVWDDLSTKFIGSTFIRLGKVDCTVEKLLCKLHKVRGYPTLLLFRDGEMISEYSGARDVGSLEAFVLKNIEPHDEL
ncbi:thioredoxin domain-containing protein 5-like [Pecten maximus]|uniref:thioredoxin domain-containing protein 5-like n=1 Tax=Pecten maximus TaxID=6579 RepID=UPI001458765D|nr:thioredoxin domain-containing protein 5-like [Pecten maximus]